MICPTCGSEMIDLTELANCENSFGCTNCKTTVIQHNTSNYLTLDVDKLNESLDNMTNTIVNLVNHEGTKH